MLVTEIITSWSFRLVLPMLGQTGGLQHWSVPRRSQFSWAGGRPQMSTSRHLRKYRGLSPSTRTRCPPALCCCTSLGCKSPPQKVYDPRCGSWPGRRRKLVWRRTLLRVCPVVRTNRFNQGWCDFFGLRLLHGGAELPLWIIRLFFVCFFDWLRAMDLHEICFKMESPHQIYYIN